MSFVTYKLNFTLKFEYNFLIQLVGVILAYQWVAIPD